MKTPVTPIAWANLLTKVWGNNYPIDPIIIAKDFTKNQKDPITKVAEFDGFDGALIYRPEKTNWYLLYNPNAELGKTNFTIAHELGHYLIHREFAAEFKCADIFSYESTESQVREKEANTFASYLLMPLDDFRKQINPNYKPTIGDLSTIADRYKVSLTAASLKWLEYTQVPALFIASVDDFVLWSWASKNARRYHLKKGTPIPANSLTGLKSTLTNAMHKKGIWYPANDVEEQYIYSDKYCVSLSLLFIQQDYTSYEEEPEELDTFDLMTKNL